MNAFLGLLAILDNEFFELQSIWPPPAIKLPRRVPPPPYSNFPFLPFFFDSDIRMLQTKEAKERAIDVAMPELDTVSMAKERRRQRVICALVSEAQKQFDKLIDLILAQNSVRPCEPWLAIAGHGWRCSGLPWLPNQPKTMASHSPPWAGQVLVVQLRGECVVFNVIMKGEVGSRKP